MDLDEILGVGNGNGSGTKNTDGKGNPNVKYHILEAKVMRGKFKCVHVNCYVPDNNIRSITPSENYLKLWFYDGYVFYDLGDMIRYGEGKTVQHTFLKCPVSLGMAFVKFNLLDKNKRLQFLKPSGSADNTFDISYINSVLTFDDRKEIIKMIELLEDGISTAEPNKKDEMSQAIQILNDVLSN
jgi:hypothetical protein